MNIKVKIAKSGILFLFLVLSLSRAFAQTDSVYIHGNYRPCKVSFSSDSTKYFCDIILTDPLLTQNEEVNAERRYQQTYDYLHREMDSKVEGIRYLITKELLPSIPKNALINSRLSFLLGIDSDGTLYYMHVICKNEETATKVRERIKSILQTLNMVYQFGKPVDYGISGRFTCMVNILPQNIEKMIRLME